VIATLLRQHLEFGTHTTYRRLYIYATFYMLITSEAAKLCFAGKQEQPGVGDRTNATTQRIQRSLHDYIEKWKATILVETVDRLGFLFSIPFPGHAWNKERTKPKKTGRMIEYSSKTVTAQQAFEETRKCLIWIVRRYRSSVLLHHRPCMHSNGHKHLRHCSNHEGKTLSASLAS